jgi:hypothetical protein
VISIDAEKALDEIQHPFNEKRPEETRNIRNVPQYNKDSM